MRIPHNPVGIDVMVPRLSWQLQSDEQNVRQTAYEIRTALSEKDLDRKNHQLWDSGKVGSDQSVNVNYDGPALTSMQRIWWQVRIWDQDDKAGDWSEPVFWEMGILKPEEWKAPDFGEQSSTDYFDQDAEKMHLSYGAGLRIAMNENFIIKCDYGMAADKRDGNSGIYIGLNYLF